MSNSIKHLITRCLIKLVNDTNGIQRMQVTGFGDEVIDNTQCIQNYGLTAYPKQGAEAICLSRGADRSDTICIACDDSRFRIKNLAEGEVCLYTDEGDTIHFKRGKLIEINAQTKLKITSPQVEIEGDLKVSGNIESESDIQAGSISLKDHIHPTPQGLSQGPQ